MLLLSSMEHRLEKAKTESSDIVDPEDYDLVLKQRRKLAQLEDTFYEEDSLGEEEEEEEPSETMMTTKARLLTVASVSAVRTKSRWKPIRRATKWQDPVRGRARETARRRN